MIKEILSINNALPQKDIKNISHTIKNDILKDIKEFVAVTLQAKEKEREISDNRNINYENKNSLGNTKIIQTLEAETKKSEDLEKTIEEIRLKTKTKEFVIISIEDKEYYIFNNKETKAKKINIKYNSKEEVLFLKDISFPSIVKKLYINQIRYKI